MNKRIVIQKIHFTVESINKNADMYLLQQSFPIQSSSNIYLRFRFELGSLYFPPFLDEETLDFIRI